MPTRTGIQLQRTSQTVPWGFRLQGGLDYRLALSVKKVNPQSPAHGKLSPGDDILAIGSYDTCNMTHTQASQMIQQSGDMLQLTVHKGTQVPNLKPKGGVKFSIGKAHSIGYS